MAGKAGKRGFGSVDQLPSGRWRARYTGPDGRTYAARTVEGRPLTFTTKGDAEAFLALRHSEVLRGAWLPPAAPRAAPVTFREYAAAWLADRDLEARTREHYGQLLRDHLLPTFGAVPVAEITPASVRTWHARLAERTGPTARAHSYGLLRTIMATALADEVIVASPCRVRGAGQVKRARTIRPASLPELEALVKAIPARYQLMCLLAAWCALRFGELAELRRSDVDLKAGVLRVSRGVVRTRESGRLVKGPKSEAGKRTVAIPPHLIPAVRDHLAEHVTGRDGLLFPAAGDPGKHLSHSTLNKVFLTARAEAGRPDLAFHDLRHTGAVLAAATGATLAELMARLGHSTPAAAMRYQHAAADRDKAIAEALSKLVEVPAAPVLELEEVRQAPRRSRRKSATP